MTAQYQQDAINLQGIIPVAFTTLDATTFIIELGLLTAPSSSVVVLFSGGGSGQSDPSLKYNVRGTVIYDNSTGTTIPTAELVILVPTGVIVAVGATADPTGNRILIRVNGPAFPFNHRLNFTRILF